MKRAEVFRADPGAWITSLYLNGIVLMGRAEYPTYTEALHAALAEVGLTPTNPEPMEAP